jgi:hypothetical protein
MQCVLRFVFCVLFVSKTNGVKVQVQASYSVPVPASESAHGLQQNTIRGHIPYNDILYTMYNIQYTT